MSACFSGNRSKMKTEKTKYLKCDGGANNGKPLVMKVNKETKLEFEIRLPILALLITDPSDCINLTIPLTENIQNR